MMRTNNPGDAIHKAWLYRVLEAIAGDQVLSQVLYFKGGTCASMLGWLDRFSIDLDFDYAGPVEDIPSIRQKMEAVFLGLGLEIKDASKNGIQYFLRYKNEGRNTLKIDAAFPLYKKSTYAPERFKEINRIVMCQKKETMVAHKLCAVMDRFEKTGHIAGRDIYDIHFFLMNGFPYSPEIITERTGLAPADFFKKLVLFIEKEVTDTVITEDLSALIPRESFLMMRKVLKREVISLLQNQIQ